MSVPKELAKAYEHIACVGVLNDNGLSRQACYHLLAAISSASSALTDGKRSFRSFEELPKDIFVRTSPIQMTNLTAALQVFATEAFEGEIVAAPDEITAWRWARLDEVGLMHTTPDLAEVVAGAFRIFDRS